MTSHDALPFATLVEIRSYHFPSQGSQMGGTVICFSKQTVVKTVVTGNKSTCEET